jgi:hypothetical protein
LHQVKVKVTLRPTIGRPVRHNVRCPSETRDRFFFFLEIFFQTVAVCYIVVPSLTKGLVCYLPLQVRIEIQAFRSNIIIMYAGHAQKSCAVSEVNTKLVSHSMRARHTLTAAGTVRVSHAIITIIQCVYLGSHDTHPHGNQSHSSMSSVMPAVHALSDHEVLGCAWVLVTHERCL